ncbi:glycosyltransferase family 4 protein [Pseudocolwellia sp. HL-MZ19]|uniref:glycosyltransferase family 4 protein n=1 Tax=Pseudocolwellia sp. HL-MZ19 TaxID=3400846 RepID=UPI003CF1B47F
MTIKPKSVLHILSSLNIGGAERFVIDLAIEQRQSLKLNSAILSFGEEDDVLVAECIKNNIPVHFVKGSRLEKIQTFKRVVSEFDVLHFHSPFTLLFTCYSPILCRRKKVIYTRHGAEPFNQFKWRVMHKITHSIVDQITFVSNEGQTVFGQVNGWQSKPQSVVDNGILIPKENNRQALDQQNLKIKLGSVARMVPLKNQICLLKAISSMPEVLANKFEVHFFGNGPCEELLKSAAAESKLVDNTHFHGMLVDRENIYKHIDVMIVTSEMEGLSIAILEAMARSIPVLATKVGGNPKLVQSNVTGQLFNYDDDKELSRLLTDIAENPQLIEKWGSEAYQLVEQDYSLETVAQKYMMLYS